MEICFVYDAVHPWETGGVQKRVWELARRLGKDHDVHWYGLHYWDGPSTIERDNVTLHGVMPPTELYVNGRRSIPEALRFAARLVPAISRGDFDVIDCQAFPYFPAFSSKIKSVRDGSGLIVTWHEVWTDYWYDYLGWKGWFGKVVERLTARLPHAHIAVSDRTRRDLRSVGVDDAQIVPNGIAMEAIEAAPAFDRSVDVLFVGRLIPEKNVELLIRAMDDLRDQEPEIRCLIVGDGPEQDTIERLVLDLDLLDNVTTVGPRDDYQEVIGLMKAADVFVLPSRREGFGITALEALACGTPVITIQHPQNAAQELVDDGRTGYVCDGRPSAIAEGIRNARSLSSADCVDAARGYEWDRIADQAEAVYREVA